MGLRCLMGHDYGALQTEREREERGEEAVVTVREFKECGRCGHRQIVSENKEVTATPSEPTDEPPTDPRQAVERDDPDGHDDASGDGFDDATADEYDDVTADEDDGVILDDSGDDRDPGDWPNDPDEADEGDSEDEEESEYDPWPEVEGDDEGYAAEPSDSGQAADVEFGGGLTPEPQDEPDVAGTSDGDDATEGSAPAGIRSVEPAGGQRSVAVNANVVCPECDHSAPAQGSSLRPGDICPACRRGYLVERES